MLTVELGSGYYSYLIAVLGKEHVLAVVDPLDRLDLIRQSEPVVIVGHCLDQLHVDVALHVKPVSKQIIAAVALKYKIALLAIDGNIGSEKTILANGGVYYSTEYEPIECENIKRFWIEL